MKKLDNINFNLIKIQEYNYTGIIQDEVYL